MPNEPETVISYQYGFHRSVSYRENCYHCIFAREERVSDVTLSDYNGLGTLAPCSFTARKVSSVLVHTDKGLNFIGRLIREARIVAEERPVREPILGDERLRPADEEKSDSSGFRKVYSRIRRRFRKSYVDDHAQSDTER